MSKAKFTTQEIKASLVHFTASSAKKYGTYAHAAGMYEGLLLGVLAELPRHTQAIVLATLNQSIAEMANEVTF